MMEAGTYNGVLARWLVAKSRTGTPHVALMFNVTHLQVGGDWEEVEGTVERTIYVYLTDAAMETSIEKLASLGWNNQLRPNAIDFGPDVKSQGVAIKCDHETYEGKKKERWELASWGGGFEPTPADDNVIRDLEAKIKNKMAQKPKPVGGNPPAGRPPAPAPNPQLQPAGATHKPITEDEIPF